MRYVFVEALLIRFNCDVTCKNCLFAYYLLVSCKWNVLNSTKYIWRKLTYLSTNREISYKQIQKQENFAPQTSILFLLREQLLLSFNVGIHYQNLTLPFQVLAVLHCKKFFHEFYIFYVAAVMPCKCNFYLRIYMCSPKTYFLYNYLQLRWNTIFLYFDIYEVYVKALYHFM